MSPRACVVALLAVIGCGSPPAPPPPARSSAPDRCGRCHLREFTRARRPQHVGQKPSTCASCHLETGWRPSVLVHEWPLTGAHTALDCFACHTGTPARMRGTPEACWGCHEDDYRGVRFAAHARFSHACQECHSTRAWSPTHEPPGEREERPTSEPPPAPQPTPARPTPTPRPQPTPQPAPQPAPAPSAHGGTHPEDAFPIARGDHRGISCARCHSRPGPDGRGNTDCVQCHARTRYDRIHRRVSDYPDGPASPNFCVGCHTRGTRSRR